MPRHSLLSGILLAMALAIIATACSTALQTTSSPDRPLAQVIQTMKPSITYLYLLRQTPFFTDLNTDQLRWVIQHSREWEAEPGQVIVSSSHLGDATGYWILLDGGWALTYQGRSHASEHDAPGKWFNQSQLDPQAFALVANDHSYVLHITTQDMDDMLGKGFNFQRHLDAGKRFYADLVAPPVNPAVTQPTP